MPINTVQVNNDGKQALNVGKKWESVESFLY